MVDEQAKLVFTIPFNIGNDDLDTFPLRDTDVAYHLRRAPDGFPTYAALVSAWHTYLTEDRARTSGSLYSEVTERCRASESSRAALDTASLAIQARDALIEAIGDKVIDLFSIGRNDVKVVFYFDGADDTLFKARHLNSGVHLHPFCRVSPLSQSPLCSRSFFRRTRTSRPLAPMNGPFIAGSLRQAPITETPFDCSPAFPLRPATLTLKDITSLHFLAQFGRPLFWTLLGTGILSGRITGLFARSCATSLSKVVSRGRACAGGFIPRLLLVLAYDAALGVIPIKEPVRYSQGCLLIDFIQALFTTGRADQILNARPDNIPLDSGLGRPFCAAFARAQVRFTHFGVLTDVRGVCAVGMLGEYLRCMAFLFVQVRRRAPVGAREPCAVDHRAFPRCFAVPDGRRYISLVMELCVQNAAIAAERKAWKKDRTQVAQTMQPDIDAPQVPQSDLEGAIREETSGPRVHPRYSIYVFGWCTGLSSCER
ncbi:hypothetical protein BKA93DRAFT_822235 [Sparassis latifolia]